MEHDPSPKRFWNNMKILRLQCQSFRTVLEQAGISPAVAAAMEEKGHMPSAHILCSLALALDIPVSWMLHSQTIERLSRMLEEDDPAARRISRIACSLLKHPPELMDDLYQKFVAEPDVQPHQ